MGVDRHPGPEPPDAKLGPLHPCLRLPSGLEDVSKYPDLVAELLRRKWTEAEVRGALADNLLRVFEEVEQVRRGHPPPSPPPPWRQAANSCLSPGEQSHTGSRGGGDPADPAGAFLQDPVWLLQVLWETPSAGGLAGLPCAPPPLPGSSVTPWGPVHSDPPVPSRHLGSPGGSTKPRHSWTLNKGTGLFTLEGVSLSGSWLDTHTQECPSPEAQGQRGQGRERALPGHRRREGLEKHSSGPAATLPPVHRHIYAHTRVHT